MYEKNILRNDETGIQDRNMYQAMLENLKEQKIYVVDNLLTTELLKKITYLHLANILELKGVDYCENLKTLVVANTDIEDISPVSRLKNLECLSLGCNNISDISPIKELTKLKRLYLGHNMIVDIEPISELVNLERVSFRGNEIVDLTPFEKLDKITNLSLEQNEIKDISVLSKLVNLSSLDVSENDITDVCALESIYNMQYLYLSFNDITDISPLVGMMNLETLEILGNAITLDDVDQYLFQDFAYDQEWLEANGLEEEEDEKEENPIIEKCRDLKAKFDERPIMTRELDVEALPNKKQAIIAGASVVVALSAIAVLFKKKK